MTQKIIWKGCDIMKKIAEFLQSLQNTKIAETNGKVKQVQARTIKSATLSALMSDFTDNGLEVGKVQKGFIVRVPNDDYGSLVIQVDAVLKPLDFDFDSAVQAEQKRQAEIKAKKKKSRK